MKERIGLTSARSLIPEACIGDSVDGSPVVADGLEMVDWPTIESYAGGASEGGVGSRITVRMGGKSVDYVPAAKVKDLATTAMRGLKFQTTEWEAVRSISDLATMTPTPAPQVPSEAARLVGGEAALVAQAQALIAQIVEVAGEHTPMGKALSKLSPIIAALAQAQAAPTDAPGEPDDMLTVAHVTTDGGGILTMLASSLGDLIDIVGDEPETYSVSIGTMKRAAFEAMGEFDGF